MLFVEKMKIVPLTLPRESDLQMIQANATQVTIKELVSALAISWMMNRRTSGNPRLHPQ